MYKIQFLKKVRAGISSLPEHDIKKSLEYYGEMIDDRVEDGMSEEEAVAAVGTVEETVAQILSEASAADMSNGRSPSRVAAWIGAGILIVLAISIAFCGVASALSSVFELVCGNGLSALFVLGAGLALLGVSGFLLLAIVHIIAELRRKKGE